MGDEDRARAIKSREPCQMGNQAAISGYFDVLWIYSVRALFCYKERRQRNMAYQAIYRKWRPQIFEDIAGQSHITNTLKNQIVNDRVSHAYLFCGTRGTGKTTCAKVFSRAVNCLSPVNGSPCNECEICKGILNGSILDVTEIDAASNNGVDNIREIREDVNFVATQTKYRVYIIDEVHMLSTGAFNALLKTLEEPPAHVIFILATTEVHKIPETILSRCQRFDFKRITPSDIIVRMKEIAHADGINIDDEAYSMLAQLADGSMRDGLSILERCVSACGNDITLQNVINVLGMIDNEMILDISSGIISNDTQNCFACVDKLVKEGKNLNVFCESLIKHLRDLLVIKISDDAKKMLDYSDEMLVRLVAQAEKTTYEKLSNAANLLSKAKADAKWVKNPRVIYELALMKLTRPELDDSKEALLDRLAAVEEKAANGIVVTQEIKEEKKEEKPKKKVEASARLYVPLDKSTLNSEAPIVKTAKNWSNIADRIVKKYNYLYGSVANRKITIDAEGIILLFKKEENATRNLAVKYLEQIQDAFTQVTSSDFVVKTAFEEDLADVLIDYWNLPDGGGKKIPESDDILVNIANNYPEIVEIQSDDENVDSAHQEELFDDDGEEREEFFEQNEIPVDDEEISE